MHTSVFPWLDADPILDNWLFIPCQENYVPLFLGGDSMRNRFWRYRKPVCSCAILKPTENLVSLLTIQL